MVGCGCIKLHRASSVPFPHPLTHGKKSYNQILVQLSFINYIFMELTACELGNTLIFIYEWSCDLRTKLWEYACNINSCA